MADDDIKNIELMLKILGNDVRTDGYFDSNLESLLNSKYSTTTLDVETQKKIFDEYNEYINDYNNDKVIQKAITLFE